MKDENPKLIKINQALHELERKYDKLEIEPKTYHKLHKQLMERKSIMIDKVLNEIEVRE